MSDIPGVTARPHGRSETPVSAEARGRLRALRSALEARAKALVTASDAVSRDLLKAVRHKTAKGRNAAMETILRAMPEQPLHREKRAALWRLLVPEGEIFMVRALAIGAFATGSWTNEPFGLAFSDHAICRLFDRRGFRADAAEAMLEGHDALLALKPEEGFQAFELPTVTLPGGPGAFLVAPRAGLGYPFAIATTWVSQEQVYPDQQDDLRRWDTLLASEPTTIAKKRR